MVKQKMEIEAKEDQLFQNFVQDEIQKQKLSGRKTSLLEKALVT